MKLKKFVAVTLAIGLTASNTLLPVNAKSTTPKVKKITLTGTNLVQRKTNTTIKFYLTKKAKKTTISILNKNNTTVRKFVIKNKKSATIKWNGKGSAGTYVASGKYRAKVTVGKYSKISSTFTISPSRDFAGGSGTKDSPYLISNLSHLKNIYYYNDCYFKQKNNIDLKYTSVMLFNKSVKFKGKYDGAGYKISNYLYSNSSKVTGVALFYAIDKKGLVKNLTLDNYVLTCGNSGGGIAVENYGTIKNCTVKGTITTLSESYDYSHNSGLICSSNLAGKIINCTVNGSVSSSYSESADKRMESTAGGIAGYNNGTIINCKSKTDVQAVSGDDDCCAGILVGKNLGTISDCETNGTCYAHAKTSLFGFGTGYSGGIVGFNSGAIISSLFTGNSEDLTGDSAGEIQGNK